MDITSAVVVLLRTGRSSRRGWKGKRLERQEAGKARWESREESRLAYVKLTG
jgi:hypothetical protein